MIIKSSLLKDIGSVFRTKIIVLCLSLFSVVLLARALGVEGRGLLAAVLIYPQLLIAITEGGMRQAATFFIGQKKASDAEVLGALLSYVIFAGIAGYLVVSSLMLFFDENQFSVAIIAIAATILPTSLAVNAFQGYFLGKQQIKNFNRVLLFQRFLYVFALIFLYVINMLTLFSVVLVTALAALYNAFQTFIYVNKTFHGKIKFNISVIFSMLKIGVVYAIALFLMQMNYKVDILLLNWLSSPVELGGYAVTVQLGELLWQLPSAVLTILMSRSANSYDNSMVPVVCKTTRLTLFVTFILSLLMLLSGYYLIVPVFGSDYSGVFFVLLMLTPGLVVATIFKTINAFYAGKGQAYYAIYVMGIAVFFNVLGNYILIPHYGGVGAAISSSISYLVSAIVIVFIFAFKESVNIKDILLIKRKDFRL